MLLLFLGIICTITLWKYSPIIQIIIIVITLTTLTLYHNKDDLVFFIIGVLFDGLGEIMAVYFGAWTYAQPELWGIPLWIPIFWGTSFVLMRRIRNIFFQLKNINFSEKISHKRKILSMSIYDVGTYLLILILVISLWQNIILLTLLLSIICIINIAKFHHIEDIFVVIFVGIVGTIADYYAVKFGLWTYTKPTFIYQPLWVFPLYTAFGLITVRTAFIFSKIKNYLLIKNS